jgi:hypothetical protein
VGSATRIERTCPHPQHPKVQAEAHRGRSLEHRAGDWGGGGGAGELMHCSVASGSKTAAYYSFLSLPGDDQSLR